MELSKEALAQREHIFEQFKKYAPDFTPMRSTPIGQTDYNIQDIDHRTIRTLNMYEDSSKYNVRIIDQSLVSNVEDNSTYRIIASNFTAETFREIIKDMYYMVIEDDNLMGSIFGLIKFNYDDSKLPVNVVAPGGVFDQWTLYRSREYRNRSMKIEHEDIEFIDLVVVSNLAVFKEQSKIKEEVSASLEISKLRTDFDSEII